MNTVKQFYNQFPYPNFKIENERDLKMLHFQKFLFEIAKSYKKSGKILEAGCGTGELILMFGQNGYDAYGIDLSTKALSIAQNNAKKLKVAIHLKEMDVLKLEYPTNTFDLVLSNGVLHHTQNPQEGFKQIVRSTKSKGIIMIVLYNKYGSLPRKIMGKIIKTLLPGNINKQIKIIRRITGNRYATKSDSVIADTFFNPHEKSFTISDVLTWFQQSNIEYLESAPPIEINYYPKIVTTILQNKPILETWLKIRIQHKKSTPKKLMSLLIQIVWMLTLKGNVFLFVGEKQ